MKRLDNSCIRNKYSGYTFFFLYFAAMILFLASCTGKPEPYSILEFTGVDNINNYSRSFLQVSYKSDSVSPLAVPGSIGDLFICDENGFVYKDASSQTKFLFKTVDSELYVNGKIISIKIPDNDNMIPWFEKMKDKDLSALQFINFKSDIKESYFPYLTELAKTIPNIGINFSGDFSKMAGLLKIFSPQYILGPSVTKSDFDLLSKLKNLEILMVSLNDSIISDPLPAMPELEQLFLSDDDKTAFFITNDFLVKNKQIEKLFIWNQKSFDFSILNPLGNLKVLVVNGADTILNPGLINNHKSLELLSLISEKNVYNPDLIKLPNLKWMTFYSNVTQEEFSSFTDSHPNLEMVEILKNDTIKSYKPLTNLKKLYGLTIVDTVTDISTIKTLTNLKFLSLPVYLLRDTAQKAELLKSLPGTHIVANEGFCLGSGWLLLIIPFVLTLGFFGRQKR
jgi:hypothetical protein